MGIDKLFKYQEELDLLTNLTNNNPKNLLSINKRLADAEQVWSMMKEKKKSVRCKIQNNITQMLEKEGKKTINAQTDMLARASDDNFKWLDTMEVACKIYFDLKNEQEAVLNRIEALRSFISLEKSLNNLR